MGDRCCQAKAPWPVEAKATTGQGALGSSAD